MLAACRAYPVGGAHPVRVTFELSESADRYRMRIENRDRGAIAFDEETFFILAEGAAPTGMRIVVRDRADREIYTSRGGARGYTVNGWWSTLWPAREPIWRKISPGEVYSSPWFSLHDLVKGLETVAAEPDPKKWKDFTLLFSFQLRDEKAEREAVSETFPLSARR